jgi:predicted Ser/Thr protein kinase
MASESQLSNKNLISEITDKLTTQGHNISIVKEAMDGLSPQDIGMLISDKVNDDITQFKRESNQDTKHIDQLVEDINKSHEVSDKEMKSLVDNIEKQDINFVHDIENENVENALSNYNYQKEIELKELELEKELSLPSL